MAAAGGDIEEEVDRPQRRGEGVAHAAFTSAGGRVALAHAVRHADRLGIGQLDRPIVQVFLAEELFDRGEALGQWVGLRRGQRVDMRGSQHHPAFEVGHEERHPLRALGQRRARQRGLWPLCDDSVGRRGELGLVLRVAPVTRSDALALGPLRVEVRFIADLDGQDLLRAHLEGVVRLCGRHGRVVRAEVDPVDDLPAGGPGEREEFIHRCGPDRARIDHIAVVLHRFPRRLPVAREEGGIHVVRPDAQHPRPQRPAEVDQRLILRVKAIAGQQLLLGAQSHEISRQHEPGLVRMDRDGRGGRRSGGKGGGEQQRQHGAEVGPAGGGGEGQKRQSCLPGPAGPLGTKHEIPPLAPWSVLRGRFGRPDEGLYLGRSVEHGGPCPGRDHRLHRRRPRHGAVAQAHARSRR